ncbi:uncharacterized protein LOC126375272 [Pectinophora gossypiella]|uniref:uncharacterized protein LOC126375272 n=1 Tax=Pectinophora gossypiella TaxID=13191 RepID=UPI00214E148D|nr:uncharacterized protein LOC126375272 [Pectinophora gossypiella]
MAAAGIPPVEGLWSDDKCVEIANRDHFPAAVKDIGVQKSIIDRFLNFYLKGKPHKGLSVTDVTFAVISIMPLCDSTEQFIFQPSQYKDNGTLFFLTPEDKLKDAVDDIQVKDCDNYTEPELIKTEGQINKRIDTVEVEKNDEIHVDKPHDQSEKIVDDAKFTVRENNDCNAEYLKNTPRDKHTDNVNHNHQQETKQGATEGTGKEYIPKLPLDMIRYKKVSKPLAPEEIRPQYGPLENAAFIISCNKLLDEWDTNQKARIILKYFFGIVALILMRTTTKKYKHLVNTFGGNKFLTTIYFTENYINYSVPHKKCFKNCYRVFSKRDGNIPVMFAKIVNGSFYFDALQRENLSSETFIWNLNIFKLGLLAHTADYGFGLVGMVQNLHGQLGNINSVVEVTYCAETAESWCRMKNFIDTYMTSASHVATYRWARVISTQYFKDISCSTNYELSVILAVFTEKATKSSDIWKSSWVQNGENLETLKRMGLDMYEKFEANVAKGILHKSFHVKKDTFEFDFNEEN